MDTTQDASQFDHSFLLGQPGGSLILEVRRGPDSVEQVHVDNAKCTVGADNSCTIRVPSDDASPLNCLILRGQRHTIVRRWSDGVTLNNEDFRDARLSPGDVIRVGNVEIAVVDDQRTCEPAGEDDVELFDFARLDDERSPDTDQSERPHPRADNSDEIEQLQSRLADSENLNQEYASRVTELEQQLAEKLAEIESLRGAAERAHRESEKAQARISELTASPAAVALVDSSENERTDELVFDTGEFAPGGDSFEESAGEDPSSDFELSANTGTENESLSSGSIEREVADDSEEDPYQQDLATDSMPDEDDWFADASTNEPSNDTWDNENFEPVNEQPAPTVDDQETPAGDRENIVPTDPEESGDDLLNNLMATLEKTVEEEHTKHQNAAIEKSEAHARPRIDTAEFLEEWRNQEDPAETMGVESLFTPVDPSQEAVAETRDDLAEGPLARPRMDTVEFLDEWQNQEDPAEAMGVESLFTPAAPTQEPSTESQDMTDGEAGDGEVSIEQYMNQLLSRSASDDRPTVAPSPKQAQAAPVAEKVAEPVVEAEPVKVMDASEFVPRSQAPETNLRAMRELANQSARSAIDRHAKSRIGSNAMSNMLVAVCIMMFGAMVAAFGNHFVALYGIGGLITLGGVVCLLKGFFTNNSVRTRNPARPKKQKKNLPSAK